jgi:predicted amidohydrolase YtcJ
MKIIQQLLLAAAFVVVPNLAFADNHELAREPHGIDTPVPESSQPQPAAPAQKITIYTAKTIITLDPGTPTAEAVAVMDGKILGVGTLDEVKGWVTNQEVEIDRRFEDAVIIPGLIEAHMHPQITGVLWLGAYVDRFDRTAPDGTLVKGMETKQAVLDRLKDAAAKLPNDGSWLVG